MEEAIFSLFKSFISEIKFDRNEVDIPLNGENIIIKKTFFYDGQFKYFINTTDPSKKTTLLHYKERRRMDYIFYSRR